MRILLLSLALFGPILIEGSNVNDCNLCDQNGCRPGPCKREVMQKREAGEGKANHDGKCVFKDHQWQRCTGKDLSFGNSALKTILPENCIPDASCYFEQYAITTHKNIEKRDDYSKLRISSILGGDPKQFCSRSLDGVWQECDPRGIVMRCRPAPWCNPFHHLLNTFLSGEGEIYGCICRGKTCKECHGYKCEMVASCKGNREVKEKREIGERKANHDGKCVFKDHQWQRCNGKDLSLGQPAHDTIFPELCIPDDSCYAEQYAITTRKNIERDFLKLTYDWHHRSKCVYADGIWKLCTNGYIMTCDPDPWCNPFYHLLNTNLGEGGEMYGCICNGGNCKECFGDKCEMVSACNREANRPKRVSAIERVKRETSEGMYSCNCNNGICEECLNGKCRKISKCNGKREAKDGKEAQPYSHSCECAWFSSKNCKLCVRGVCRYVPKCELDKREANFVEENTIDIN